MQYTIIGGIKYKNKAAKKLNIPAFEPSKAEIYISDATPVCQVGDNVDRRLATVLVGNVNGKIIDISR